MSRWRRIGLAVLCLFALLVVTHESWMSALGRFLISEDPVPQRADLILVFAGDGTGHRILKAAALAKAGVAPVVLVSGPNALYGTRESALAISYAVRSGYDPKLFVPFDFEAMSTREEAAFFAREVARRGARNVVAVTSDYHTRRAGSLLRPRVPGVQVHIISAPSPPFTAESWWHTRTGRKIFLYEWMKTAAEKIGL